MIITLFKLLEIDNPMLQVMKAINSENVNQELAYFEDRFDSHRTTGTPFHLAVRSGHVRVVEYLLQVGGDVDKKDSQGWTPLDIIFSRVR